MNHIHPAEKLLTGVLALWLVFQPWAIGTMHVWSQGVALALGALAFGLALYPRLLEGVPGFPGPVRAAPWRILIRLPLFWLVLALFAYVTIQGLNPRLAFASSSAGWWLEKRDAIAWLPSGVEAPFSGMNAWRRLFIWASPFLAGCALWLGITRRRTVQALLVVFVINAVAVGGYALIQQFAGTKKIFWHFFYPHAAGPFGSFIYKNHAAAFLVLAFCAAWGVGLHFHLRGVARGARSTPAPVFGFLAVVIAAAAFFSLSRLGAVLTVMSAGLLALGATALIVQRRLGRVWLPLGAGLILVAAAAWGATQFDTTHVEQGLKRLEQGITDESPALRIYTYDATREMLRRQTAFGIGAGAFRHVAPPYLRSAPAVVQEVTWGHNWKNIRRYRMHEAHNDLLQLVAEHGAVGGAITLAIGAFGLAALTVSTRRRHPVVVGALVAAVGLIVFAVLDFPLHNPAVLAAFVFMATAACRWADLETRM